MHRIHSDCGTVIHPAANTIRWPDLHPSGGTEIPGQLLSFAGIARVFFGDATDRDQIENQLPSVNREESPQNLPGQRRAMLFFSQNSLPARAIYHFSP